MCIPTGFTLDMKSLHSLISANYILDSAGHDMVNARHTICRRRTFIKYERGASLTLFHALFEKVLRIPLLKHFLNLILWKVGDADGSHFSLPVSLFQQFVAVNIVVHRMVQDHQINPAHLKPF